MAIDRLRGKQTDRQTDGKAHRIKPLSLLREVA